MFSIIVIFMVCLICMLAGWAFSFVTGKLKCKSPRQEAMRELRAYDPD